MSPLEQPAAALQQAVAALQQASLSQRRDLDWQAQFEALRTVQRLALHHAAVLAPALHAVVLLVAPIVDALRSTLSRLAIAVFQARVDGKGRGDGRGCSPVLCPLPSSRWPLRACPPCPQSIAEQLGPALDPELEAFVPLLLKRAGQVEEVLCV